MTDSPAPQERLGDRLNQVRRRLFVGRAAELTLFRSLLATDEPPFLILNIFGPGGVGKTSLLRQYELLAAEAGAAAYYLNGASLEPTPQSFLAGLGEAMALPPVASPLARLAEHEGRQFLFVDTFERLAPLYQWLRDHFLPQLSTGTMVILAGREPLPARWRTDAAWQSLIRIIGLRNLERPESELLLRQRGMPDEVMPAIVAFTHGHPLALSLAADVFELEAKTPFVPAAQPDIIRGLVQRFLENVPGLEHRLALEASAQVRLLNEPLLAELLAVDDAHSLFTWLSGLSLIEVMPNGLAPHQLARTVLDVDLRWRNPDWYAELHRRARRYYNERLRRTTGAVQEAVLIDYIYLHRDNPVIRPFMEQLLSQREPTAIGFTEPAAPADHAGLAALVARHEGDTAGQLAAYWLERQPEGAQVIRDLAGAPVGFLFSLALADCDPAEEARDPAVAATRQYLRGYAPLRLGEQATLFRFWLARDTYQGLSRVQALLFVNMVRHYLTTPNLAFSFLPCADPEFWETIFHYVDLARLPVADYTIGGQTYGVYGHDWRVKPVDSWLELLAEREIARHPAAIVGSPASERLVVLSRPDFETAVADALRELVRLDRLASSPLLRSQMVASRLAPQASERARVEALQEVILDAARMLQASARGQKYYRALYHAYIQPAPTHETAAELIDVPYGTFRRHLRRAVAEVTDLLWQREIGSI